MLLSSQLPTSHVHLMVMLRLLHCLLLFILAISNYLIIKKVGTPDQATHETDMVKSSAADNIDKSSASLAFINKSSQSLNLAQRGVATTCVIEAFCTSHATHGIIMLISLA